MPVNYQHQQVVSFHLTNATFARTYHALRFPQTWLDPLLDLSSATTGRSRTDGVSIPIASLNRVLTAVVPDLLVVASNVQRDKGAQPWLYSYQPVERRALFAVAAAWVRALGAPPDATAAALSAMRVEDLKWTPIEVNFANPTDRDLVYQLLPMEAAAALTRQDAPECAFDDTTAAAFRRCPPIYNNYTRRAEVMSWPPFGLEKDRPFSVTAAISAQHHPFDDGAHLNLHIGVRRWMPERGKRKMSVNRGHTVYLAPSLPYLPGLTNTGHFSTASIRRTVVGKNPDNTAVWGNRWDDRLSKVLTELGCLDRLPDPDDLHTNATHWMHGSSNAAALVFRNGMLDKERVSAGLSIADRRPVVDWAAKLFAPDLSLAEPRPRVKAAVYPKLRGATPEPEPAALCRQLHSTLGGHLEVELLTGESTASYALDQLTARLGVAMPTVNELRAGRKQVTAGNVTVGITFIDRPELTADLGIDKTLKGRKAKHQAAVDQRIGEIDQALPAAVRPTVTLVEIFGADHYTGSGQITDPKFAIRTGLLRKGRLTQFITPLDDLNEDDDTEPQTDDGSANDPTKQDRERVRASVDELWRQLGVRPLPLPEPAPGTLPRRPALLALWVIRRNKTKPWGTQRQVPVALYIGPTGHEVRVRTPSTDWLPLHEGLLEIGRRHTGVTETRNQADIIRFVEETIREAATEHPDTLLLTHAQNLRGGWPFVGNGKLVLDAIAFSDTPRPITAHPGLRHVRIRTDDSGESPECYAVTDTETGHAQGLWHLAGDRVYGSTGAKPAQKAGARHSASKIRTWHHPKAGMRPPSPRAKVWNPQFVELTVAATQPGDQTELWAAATHELRWAAPYVRTDTTLPWPLHIAKQVAEYIVPIDLDNEAEGDSEGAAAGMGDN